MGDYPYNAIGRWQLPNDDDAAVERTIGAMRAIVMHAIDASIVRGLSISLSPGEPDSNHSYGRVLRIYNYLLRNIRFKPDPPGVELVRTPEQLISEISRMGFANGDCDDRAMLAAALLEALGIPAAFVVVGRAERGPFSHVLPAAMIRPDEWVPFDSQERELIGDLPAGVKRIRVYSVRGRHASATLWDG